MWKQVQVQVQLSRMWRKRSSYRNGGWGVSRAKIDDMIEFSSSQKGMVACQVQTGGEEGLLAEGRETKGKLTR